MKATASIEAGRGRRLRQRRPVQPALAVDVRGDDELPLERPVRAGRDRDVGPADELEHPQRVRGRLLQRLVAVRRRHAEELDLGAREREQQRDRVVVPGVAVEDDRRAHGEVYSRTPWLRFAPGSSSSRSRCPRPGQDQPWEEDTVAKVRKKIFVFLGARARRR